MNKYLLFATLMLALLGSLPIGLARLDHPSADAAPRAVTWPPISLTPIVTGLSQPTTLTHANDNSGRIFVTERAGTIRIIQSGVLLATPFLNIGATGANRITTTGAEEGLLGLAFAPGYGTAHNRFYIYYTNPSSNLVIARYTASANPNIADVNSEQIILTINHPGQTNHNGGQLQFGSDGYLYVGVGDGGGGGDVPNNAQNPAQLLGKLLRLNVEFPATAMPARISAHIPFSGTFEYLFPLISKNLLPPAPPITYTIPASNPYTQTVGYRGEIWALGLRNPWRFSFDRQTNDLYIGDVGQNLWEEIDFQSAGVGGANYGWRILEATHCFNPPSGCVPPANYAAPVVEYSHALGCSVTGGYVYRGAISAMQGIYFYGDFCSGRVWGLQKDGATWVTQQLAQPAINLPTFGEDQAGNLYGASFGGVIYQITSP